jgi:CheY-like chemotaxis protein
MSPSPENRGAAEAPTRRVLVVDDEPTLRLGFAYALASRHTRVDTAATGRDALDKLGRGKYDLLVLDLRMPDMDGMAVVESLRQSRNNIPIVLCSAAIPPAVICRAISHGVVDFLEKPVHPDDLRKIVNFVLGTKTQPLPLALEAARHQRFREASAHLENDTDPPAHSAAWHTVFKSMPPPRDRGALDALLEYIRTHMTLTSFHQR